MMDSIPWTFRVQSDPIVLLHSMPMHISLHCWLLFLPGNRFIIYICVPCFIQIWLKCIEQLYIRSRYTVSLLCIYSMSSSCILFQLYLFKPTPAYSESLLPLSNGQIWTKYVGGLNHFLILNRLCLQMESTRHPVLFIDYINRGLILLIVSMCQ